MVIRVELYGIARARAGTASILAEGETLGEVLAELEDRFPDFGAACVEGGRLRPGYIANLDGARFVRDPATPLTEGQCVLILSTDAGG